MGSEMFHWDDERLEMEILEPKRTTFVPLSGNRLWALIPTDLDWYCYCVNLPNWMRILKRLGLYLKVDGRQGPISAVLENMRVFYGADYLRLNGRTGDVSVEIKVFPDVEESLLYLAVSLENQGTAGKEIQTIVAADFEYHPAPWAGKGFTEDATQDYSGRGRKLNVPKDDRVKKTGSIFYVYDNRNPGVGFIASEKLSGWTLDRSKFSFETPFTGYQPNRDDEGVVEWTNERSSDDGICVFRIDNHLRPSQKQILPVVVGYQERENTSAISDALRENELAFEKTKSFYQRPIARGVKVETPDPCINAQFNLYNVFIKMNEHHCGAKTGFLPAAHYHNWLCGDSISALSGYVYSKDWEPVLAGLGLFRRTQLEDGFIRNLSLWTEDPSRERGDLPNGEALNYIVAVCGVMKIVRDRKLSMEYLPSLKKAIDCVLGYEKEGLIFPGGEFGFDAIDWPCGFGHCPQTFASVYTFKALMDLSDLAEWLGEKKYAKDLRTRARRLKRVINEKLWMEDRGYYRVGLPEGKVGKDEHDRQLFSQEMISWGSLVAVVWGVADGERAIRAIENVKNRLCSPWGVKLFDPPWSPSYTDRYAGITYEAGRVQNGAYWRCWYTIEYLVRAENILGDSQKAFEDLLEVRLDNVYRRCTLKEKDRELYFITSGEWIDTDLTFPVTSIPYTLTAAFFNQTVLESILGIHVGYEEIRLDPHLPSSWPGAKVTNLTIGDSEWTIQIRGNGKIKRILLDGKETKTIPIKPGKHNIETSDS